MDPGSILTKVGTVLVDENSIIMLICGMCIFLELCPCSRNDIFSDLENMAVESMRIYSPLL